MTFPLPQLVIMPVTSQGVYRVPSPDGRRWYKSWASLVVQWFRICLSMQGTRVQSLVQEDPTHLRATKPVGTTTEPKSLEPMLHNKRSHCNEKRKH